MIFMIETADLDDSVVDEYLAGFEEHFLAGALERELGFVACWRTPSGLGEPVTVTVVLSCADWAAWERARNAAVGDPRVREWIALRERLGARGRRRFATGATFSPLR